jgi:hypothetical protein
MDATRSHASDDAMEASQSSANLREAIEPSEGTLDDSSSGDDEALRGAGAFDDLDCWTVHCSEGDFECEAARGDKAAA